MFTVRLSMTFLVTGVVDLDAHTDAVMDQLLAIESVNDNLMDSDLDAVLSKNLVTVSLVAIASSFDQAEMDANSAIRSAIHAAGGSTPEWSYPKGDVPQEANYSIRDKHAVPA